jgi:hypothetical protein
MSQFVRDLVKAERRRQDFSFIIDVVQRGKIRAAKYKHDLTMPLFLYEEMRESGVINPEDYYVEEAAFFEFKCDEVVISFRNLYACEDLHRRIDRYLVIKFAGSYPIKRGGRMF